MWTTVNAPAFTIFVHARHFYVKELLCIISKTGIPTKTLAVDIRLQAESRTDGPKDVASTLGILVLLRKELLHLYLL